jgi:tripartite-type tricarboxylate transporter receptor subunit TctC
VQRRQFRKAARLGFATAAVGPMRITFIVGFLVAGIVSASAQTNYPEKSIRLLYGFPAGNDLVTRIFADKLAEALGKPVVVDNVTGAGGNIAADRTAKAAPDGYTIGVLIGANITINPTLYKKLPYDPVKDLIPVSLIFEYPSLLVINNEVRAKDVKELVGLARAQPGQLTFGHAGVGTPAHLAGEIFRSMAHIDIQDVPYRGPSPTLTDLVGARITMGFLTPSVTLPLVREGKVRALAVTSRTRAPFAPELPNMGESGFPGFDVTTWFGLFAPAGTPAPIIERLNRETVRIVSSPEVQKRILDLGQVPRSSSPNEFVELIKAETPYWASVIKQAGIKQIE